MGHGWQGWLNPRLWGDRLCPRVAVGGTRELKQRSGAGGSARLRLPPPSMPDVPDTHMPPMVTVAQVRSEKAGTVSVAPLAGRM